MEFIHDQLFDGWRIRLLTVVDQFTRLISPALEDWAWRNHVKLDFIQPRKPIENGYIKSFNGLIRDECVNVSQLLSLNDARAGSKLGALTTPSSVRTVHLAT
jgi:putative transposase